MKPECPACHSALIVEGRCLGQNEHGFGFVFRPRGLNLFAFTGTDVPISGQLTACLNAVTSGRPSTRTG